MPKRSLRKIRQIWLILILAAFVLGGLIKTADPAQSKTTASTRIESAPTETTSKLESQPRQIPVASPETALIEPADPLTDGQLTIHFLDVGQGHATIFSQNDHAVVIDGGDRDSSSFVVAYLKEKGIKTIDAIIATHYDSDHVYGLVGVLNAFPVDAVYDADYRSDTKVYASFMTAIKAEGCPEIHPSQGDLAEFTALGGLTATFTGPRDYGYDQENDLSLAILMQFGKTRFLIMGDTTAEVEQDMLFQKLKADVLLAAHHGSNGSSSKDFLSTVQPNFIVISCGLDNPYGHPGASALKRMQQIGAELYRTDLQGLILCKSDGQELLWNQPACNDFTPGS